MSEERRSSAPGGPPQAPVDSELEARTIVGFGIGLAAVLVVVFLVLWGLSAYFKAARIAADPEPSPLAEARVRALPPEPRLERSPPAKLRELRAEEEHLLTTYGWVDEAAGVGRIPIERALEILAERGLPAASRAPGGGPARGTEGRRGQYSSGAMKETAGASSSVRGRSDRVSKRSEH